MIRRRFLIIIVSLATIVLLGSCVSTHLKGPATPLDTLVLGTIRLEATNYQYFGASCVNGTHYSGVQLEIRRLDAEQLIKVRSFGKEGFFFIQNLQSGRYQITRLYFEDVTQGDRSYIFIEPGGWVFKIGKQAVYNLGGLVWFANNWSQRMSRTRHQEYTKQLFSEKYPDSGWLNVKWVDVHL
jgi:hypothetical protein